MNERLEYLLNEIRRLGYSAEKDDGNIYCIGNYSPQGQDCNATIDSEGDANLFIDNMRAYASDFDVSYEAYLWLDSDGHGKNGAPYDMREVYEDMEWWQNSIEELANTLEILLSEHDNLQENP